MGTSGLASLFILEMTAFALAQDQKGSQKETYGALELGIRIVSLGGEFDDEDDWDDIWNTGGGLSLGYAQYWRLSQRVEAGLYAKLTVDFFSGETQEGFDPDPSTLFFEFDIDTLAMERIIVGGVYRFDLGRFFIDVRGGIGLALYGGVEADYEDETVIVTGIEVIEASVAFASEFGLQAGLRVSRRVDLSLGLALEVNGPPDLGQDAKDAGFSSPGSQVNFATTIGIGINF